MRNWILLSLPTALVISAQSARADEDQTIDCENPMSTAEMNLCASKDFDAANRELNRVYKTLLIDLGREASRGEEWERNNAIEARRILRAAL